MTQFSVRKNRFLSTRFGLLTATVAAGAAATAVWVEVLARRAERNHPPVGGFIDVDGARLHYVMRGDGPPVVLLHGNTVTHADFSASGLLDRLAQNHQVIAFDRPGYGYSSRPRDRLWTPFAQAAVFHAALKKLGIQQAVVVGHSMGTMVALAMALNYPTHVRKLVLIGGYFHPDFRLDAVLTAPVALPVLGDVMRYTVTALSGRALLGRLAKSLFTPKAVPENFFPTLSKEMMLRPGQLRANAEDAAFMMPAAKALSARYAELKMPVAIVVGKEDAIVDMEDQSERLHRRLPQSELHVLLGMGHMVHYAAQDLIVNVIDTTGVTPRSVVAP